MYVYTGINVCIYWLNVYSNWCIIYFFDKSLNFCKNSKNESTSLGFLCVIIQYLPLIIISFKKDEKIFICL